MNKSLLIILIVISLLIIFFISICNVEKFKENSYDFQVYPSQLINTEIFIDESNRRVQFNTFEKSLHFCAKNNKCVGFIRDTADGVKYIPRKIEKTIKLENAPPKTITFLKKKFKNNLI